MFNYYAFHIDEASCPRVRCSLTRTHTIVTWWSLLWCWCRCWCSLQCCTLS